MRKSWIILIILTSCTQQPKKSFGTIAPNPIVESRRTNKIKYYETFSINADTIVKDGVFKLDDNGRTIEIRNLNITQADQQTSYIEYDSLGQQKESTETLTYDSSPDQQLLTIKAYDKGRDVTIVSYLKFDKDLVRVLRKTMINLTSKDTVHDLTYEYEKNKLVKANDLLHRIEYHYDLADKLKEVRTISGFGLSIDYISPSTGLIDSTVNEDEEGKLVTYYKYYK